MNKINKFIEKKDYNKYGEVYNKAVDTGYYIDLEEFTEYLHRKYGGMIDISTGEIYDE